MCAAIPVMPNVVMVPLTNPDPGLTEMEPVPAAAVVTAGVSCAPMSVTVLTTSSW